MSAGTLRKIVRAAALLLASTAGLGQTTIHIPTDQLTIQAGINAANNGDTVLVAPNIYHENIDFKGKAITVTSSGGAAQTTIVGTGAGATVVFDSGETRASVISNLTISGGGAAVTPGNPHNVGGIYTYNATPTILNNVITGNGCNGIVSDTAAPLIQGNTISSTINVPGGTCWLSKGAAILQVANNPATLTTQIVPTILSNIIENNVKGVAETGGIYLTGANYTVIQGNTIRNNVGVIAGAIAADSTNVVSVVQNLIYGNSAGGTGGISLIVPASPSYTAGPFAGIIAENTIAGNSVTYLTPGPGNKPTSQVSLSGNLAQFIFVNNIIAGNIAGTAAVSCDPSHSYLSLTPPVFDHNDIFAAQGFAYAGACADQTGISGNINADPQFTAPGDYHVLAHSPAVDAGNNSAPLLPATDIGNSPRIADATGAGYPIIDMGAYEFAGLLDGTPTVLTLTPSTYLPFPGGKVNAPFILTAQLTSTLGVPTGSISFYEDSILLGTSGVDATGSAIFTPPLPIPGIHAFTATYQGQGSFSPATSLQILILFPKFTPTLTLTSSPNPSVAGNSVTFTATITSPDGDILSPVVLTDTTTNTVLPTSAPNSSGVTTYTTSTLAIGSHTIIADYAGDATHNAATASLDQEVVAGTITTIVSSANPSPVNQPVTFTATITSTNGTPTGTVTFADGATPIGVPQPVDTSGNASITTSSLSAGGHIITATYNPTGSFVASSASLTQTVRALTDTIAITANPSTTFLGNTVVLSATVTPSAPGLTPTGTVVFSSNAGSLGQATLVNGVATLSTTALPLGSNQVAASYLGDATYLQATASPTTVIITATPSSLTVAPSVNPSPALTPITFSTHLLANGQPATAGYAVTVTLTPISSGASPGGSQQLTTDTTGAATYTLPGLLPGTYRVTAAFAGTASLQAATASSFVETVTANPTAVTLTASPNPGAQNQLETFTATVLAAAGVSSPGGTVTIVDTTTAGTTTLATLPLPASIARVPAAATVTFSTTSLAVGLHTLLAIYTPTASFTASQSTALSLNIETRGITLTLSNPDLTVQTGHHAAVTASLTSSGGISGTFNISCGSMPEWTTCNWGSPTLTLPADGTVSTTVTIDTNQLPGFVAANRPADSPRTLRNRLAGVTFATLIPFAFFGLRRRNRLRSLLPVLLLTALAATLTACGSSLYPSSTAPGTYTIPITASGAAAPDGVSISQTVNLTLVVTR